jgi:hypothetical protein
MKYMIDPVADSIFNAVGSTVTKQGTVDVEPKTDEDWDKIHIGAVSLAEGAYLLKIRRPFTPPGDENNSTGPEAVELSPAQITAKVERDPVEWNARIEALRNGARALDVVKRKASTSWGRRRESDKACEACHRSYCAQVKALSSIRSSDAVWRRYGTGRRGAPARSRRNREGPQAKFGSRQVIAAAVSLVTAVAQASAPSPGRPGRGASGADDGGGRVQNVRRSKASGLTISC